MSKLSVKDKAIAAAKEALDLKKQIAVLMADAPDFQNNKLVALQNEKTLRKAITDCLEFEAKQFEETEKEIILDTQKN